MSLDLKNAIKIGLNQKPLLKAIGLILMLSSVQAQESSDDSVEKLENTEVYSKGIKGSLLDAINAKREASGVVDAISAEEVGKFPDKNVGEALSRIPGVAISRDFGEGQGVTIRGLAPGLNITQINGQAVGTAQWFVLSQAERNFNFEMMSSEMVAGVKVYKSAQADIDEGALGGTVDLLTRRPLDLDSGTFDASFDMQYGDLAEKWDPSGSFVYSWKNDDSTLGILVAASLQNRTVRRQATETFGFFGPADTRLGDNFVAPNSASDRGIIPWGVGSALFQQDRERVGTDINLQWSPNDNFTSTFHYFTSKLNADNQNQNFIGIPFRGIFAANNPSNGTVDNGIVTGLNVRGGDPAVWANHIAFDNIYRDGSKMQTDIIDLELEYSNDNWSLEGQLGATVGQGQNNDEFYEFWAHSQDPRANFDFTNGSQGPRIDYSPSPWVQNPDDEMALYFAFDQSNRMKDREHYYQLDFTKYIQWGAINEFKLGWKYRDRNFAQNRYVDRLSGGVVGDVTHSLGTAGYFQDGTYTVNHGTSMGSVTTFDVNRALMRQAFLNSPTCGTVPDGDMCVQRGIFDKAASFGIQEQISALYGMMNFEGDSFRGNFGLRYVNTDLTSDAYDLAQSGIVTTSQKSSYSEFLPSLNFVYDISDDMLLRFAAGRAMSRPAPFQLTSAVNLTPETSSGSAGNPNLGPLTADQFDLGIEWYFDESSLASATIFYKDIKDFIFNATAAETIEGVNYNRITRPRNGPSATLKGAEFIYQHNFTDNWGIVANYTYTDVGEAVVQDVIGDESTSRNVKFPYSSRNSYNLTGFYENQDFSGRISYNYRSKFFVSTVETGESWANSQAQLDAQFSYKFNFNWSLRLEALNLTNETIEFSYISQDGIKLKGTQLENGRRFYLGINYSF